MSSRELSVGDSELQQPKLHEFLAFPSTRVLLVGAWVILEPQDSEYNSAMAHTRSHHCISLVPPRQWLRGWMPTEVLAYG